MTPTAVILLSVAAVLHAAWNVLGKRHHPTAGFFMVSIAVGAVWLVPASARYWHAIPHMPPEVWGFLALTAACQAFYFISLAGSYQHGHMSVAYPLARSMPAVAVAILTYFLAQGRPISMLCIVGIGLVVVGGFILPMRRLGELRLRNYLNLSCLFALLAAVGITGFTIIDDRALRILRDDAGLGLSTTATALLFFQFEMAGTVLLLAPYVFLRRDGRAAVGEVLRTKRRVIVVTGFALALTYSLVLIAMGHASNVSYVYAFAQLSIPLGALAGVVLLKEPRPPAKLVGVILIFVGVVLVALR
jgi:drug/metabolite transporter (DMT)-like permease